MPIEHQVWKIGESPQQLQTASLIDENELEDMICQDISVLSDQWMLIGRQVQTAYGKRIDLLAIDASGSLIVIELKKDKTPREVVAQTLDYASWVKNLESDEIASIFDHNGGEQFNNTQSLDSAFTKKFQSKLNEDDLNSSHQVIIVASSLDSSTERIVTYLNDYSIPINVVFFRVFKDNDSRYLSRAWFIDPATVQEHATTPKNNEPWNGEFYVSFGDDMGRNWEDARKYGFISAGGGRWYTQTLNKLQVGDRVWVNIPHTGYVGVGIVQEPSTIIDEFMVEYDGQNLPILEAPNNGTYHREFLGNEDLSEYFVRVKWVKDIPSSQAISEVGFFGNQNTVAQPTASKWRFTVDRLKEVFNID
jgi:hypothetical protein